MLYWLIITDTELCGKDYCEDFSVGVFFSRSEAEKAAEFYLKNVRGFCRYNCNYKILEKQVVGNIENNKVWIVQGWNINESSDEIDIVDSDFISMEEQAKLECEKMKKRYRRSEWAVSSSMRGNAPNL